MDPDEYEEQAREISVRMNLIDDPYLPKLELKQTANAWWSDMGKVHMLLFAFKRGMTVKEACILAGITYNQYRYFTDEHPGFSQLKAACESYLNMLAKTGLSKLIAEGDRRTTLWYLERKCADEYGPWNRCPDCRRTWR